jgi:predicted HD phosphohydrolase
MEVFTVDNTKMLFWFLEKCQGVEQSPKWHTEGDVFSHSIQVGSLAFKESTDIDLILAAYLHDVGKIVLSKGHDKIGCVFLCPYVSIKTLFLIEHHMRIWSYLKGEMKKFSKCQFLMNHPWLSELIQLARWDHMGRDPNRRLTYNKQKIIDKLNKCAEKHFTIPDYFKEYKYDQKEDTEKTKIFGVPKTGTNDIL